MTAIRMTGARRRVGVHGRFFSRLVSDRLSIVGGVVGVAIVLIVVVGPLVWSVDPTAQALSERMASGSLEHPLGTDALGRDVLSRLLHGGRTSLMIASIAVALGLVTGGLLGLVSGYLRGAFDQVVMRIMDVMIAIPDLILAIAIAAALGPGVRNTILAVVIPGIPTNARLVRSVVLSVRERDYVLAARAGGVRPSRILMRHVLPNSASTFITIAAVSFGIVILTVGALGFLGIGIQPPLNEWGAMLADAQTYIVSRPLVVLAPGLAIFITAMAGNLIGDGVRDAFDPSK